MAKLKAVVELSERYIKTSSCRDCKQFNPDMFMLKDKIWNNITTKNERKKVILLCLACVIHRLGRPITYNDFYKNIPINQIVIQVLKQTNNACYLLR